MPAIDELWIKPDWPVPAHVKSCVTTRVGGVSTGNYSSLNLGLHVGDEPASVVENRRRVQQTLGYKKAAWLEQTHSILAVKADASKVLNADASWTDEKDMACVVMTADCLPVLFCDKKGDYVAAAHAGWRGLLNGILEATIDSLPVAADQLLVWLGPAIGPNNFEVGSEVREAFIACSTLAEQAFVVSGNQDRYLADIYQLARLRLEAKGVTAVFGGDFCTVSGEQFYSYRRQNITGRMASLVWLVSDK
ncbi:peptidoglycan editing factor PgeF [Entomomonas asaccharolytica]|uniref:Purine nucleoside phosphorylase n=1 Tax=Entomomonas asaccharolytica TaxID=2785331 RepID=A0A974RXL1_9GAMM|nr:peptidoglycan editing factor PgeF [Entomomonas asaccharolytica]QQP86358.1 peptidoglycan editing factor PgeF [Entomomonas asaccharolytica]